MTTINVKFVSDEALEYLKANIRHVEKQLIANPTNSDWLKKSIDGPVFVTKKYQIEDFALEVPTAKKDIELDFRNSVLLYERLCNLPQYVLADERFWLWIMLEKGYETALKYMPIESGKSVFADHWLFTQGKRRGLFFGVLSRCYYRVALTVDNTLKDKYELTHFVIENPERFRNLSWRAFSSEKHIVLGTLKAEKLIMEQPGIVEDTSCYTEIAKAISRAGSVKLLDCMSEEEITQLVINAFFDDLLAKVRQAR